MDSLVAAATLALPHSRVRTQRTVLVHDYLLVRRGAERCFVEICNLFPDADVATLLYNPTVFQEVLGNRQVATSALQRLGASQASFRRLLPVLPFATERLPVDGYSLAISSSSAFAHGVIVNPTATHVCYCYTPFRYAWYERASAISSAPFALRPLLDVTLRCIRRWDLAASRRSTHYVAISKQSQLRIAQCWGIHAPIVYPPVELSRFTPAEPEDYFLIVGELVRHKKTELALLAAEKAGVPVKVVGSGPDEPRLRQRFSRRVSFLGRVSDDELARLYARSRAVIIANIEEFGITAVEAQAAGRPVIAADAGGARETVVDGETGLLFPQDDVRALAEAMVDPRLDRLEVARITANASRFSSDRFRAELLDQVCIALEEKQGYGARTAP